MNAMIKGEQTPIHILLVEDDEDDYVLTQALLDDIQGLRFKLTWVSTYDSALATLTREGYDLCLCDYRLGQYSGIALLNAAMQAGVKVPVVMLTGQGDRETDIAAMQAGAADYLVKTDITAPLLERSIRYTLSHAQALAALSEREEQYALVALATEDGIWDWNLKNNSVFFSTRWKAILGYDEHDLMAQICEWFDRIHPEDRGRFQSDFDLHFQGKTPLLKCEYRIAYRDGTYRWVRSCGLAVRDGQNQIVRVAGTLTDLTYHVALYDALTGLPNRNLFFDQVSRALSRVQRDPTYKLAVLYLDCDRFKFINDSLGHLIGDRLLIEIARRLESLLRPGDVFARLGGDEFAILLENLHNLEDAKLVAKRINESLASPFQLEEHCVFITTSIGIAYNSNQSRQPEDLLRDADTAMYRAKSNGKSQFAVFESSMYNTARACLQIETDLRYALDSQQFQLYYQPIFDLKMDTLVGVEALIRWFHPHQGIKLPGQFIPHAEETHLIQHIDWWVLRTACQQIMRRRQQFPRLKHFSVSVNLSRQQFTHPNLAERISALLHEVGLPAHSLKLEVTETTIIENPPLFQNLLNQLHSLGIQVQIDDFGSGYSLLSLLQNLPLSTLKIDRSFLQALNDTPKSAAIIHTIIQLAHHLGMKAIAEGIENATQLQILKDLGCDLAQGYLFAKPLPLPELDVFMARALNPVPYSMAG